MYDLVLRLKLPKNCTSMRYAHDNFLMANSTVKNVVVRALVMICGEIGVLGLKVFPSKSEAIMFVKNKRPVPENVAVLVQNPGPYPAMYEILIDKNWSFKEHFKNLISKIEGMAALLIWLMTNISDPSEGPRCMPDPVDHPKP